MPAHLPPSLPTPPARSMPAPPRPPAPPVAAPTSTPPSLARLRAFPRAPAPNNDAAAVRTNLPPADVVLCQNILAYHIGHHPGSAIFGHEQAKGFRLVELLVRDRAAPPGAPADADALRAARPADLEATTVCELLVTQGACAPPPPRPVRLPACRPPAFPSAASALPRGAGDVRRAQRALARAPGPAHTRTSPNEHELNPRTARQTCSTSTAPSPAPAPSSSSTCEHPVPLIYPPTPRAARR